MDERCLTAAEGKKEVVSAKGRQMVNLIWFAQLSAMFGLEVPSKVIFYVAKCLYKLTCKRVILDLGGD